MTKLPIHPKVRAKLAKAPLIETDERQIKDIVWFQKPRNRMLFLHDGLIYTQCFPSYYGAFFILNYERYLNGQLDEEQLDRFLGILLDKIEIPYLKAIHPQADIEGLFAALLRDRRCNTRESHLTDRINRYGRLPSWRRARKGDPRSPIMDLVLRDAPFAIALGHSPAAVFGQLHQELGKAVAQHDVQQALKGALFDRYLDHFLIGYPNLWHLVGADASRFLGAPMIKQLAASEWFGADKSVVNGKSGRSLISKGGEHTSQGMADLILDYLQGFDPAVLDARHLLLDGTRSQAWLDRCPNLDDGLDVLSRLCHYGISHPALKKIKRVAVRLPEEGQKGLVKQYLEHGSALTERLTQAIFQAKPELCDWAVDQCSGHAAVARLMKIKRLTGEQIGRLEPSVKRLLLEDDLGV
ncbi:hypothetical protein BWR15_15515 [Pseudomonas sp. T]|nr:hypothetical protein BWR15_15515 [Pseudomonas sp. T]